MWKLLYTILLRARVLVADDISLARNMSSPASAANSGRSAGSSVFNVVDSFARSNLVRGASNLVSTWDKCKNIIRNIRYTSYVVTVLLLFVVLSLLINWGKAVMLTLSILAIVFSSYQSYLVSQEACFKVFPSP